MVMAMGHNPRTGESEAPPLRSFIVPQCPGGRLFSLNVTVSTRALRKNTFQRVMVPYPEAGQWFLTLLPSCSKINVRRGNQET